MRLAAWWRWAFWNGSRSVLIMRGKREITCKGKLLLRSGLGAEGLDEFGEPLWARKLAICVPPAHRKKYAMNGPQLLLAPLGSLRPLIGTPAIDVFNPRHSSR